MSTTIEVSINDLAPLKEFYTQKAALIRRVIEDKNAELDEVIKVIRSLDKHIAASKELPINILQSNKKPSGDLFPDYNPLSTWQGKIEYFIESFGKLTTTQLSDYIIQAEPGRDRKSVVSSVSATLSQKIAPKGIFLRESLANNEYVYFIAPKTQASLLD